MVARTLTLTDDLDGTAGASERKYSISGIEYEIDLTDANFAALLQILEPYRTHSRVAKTKRQNQAPVISPEDRDKIRAWAIANGRQIASRGRFPNDIVRDYYATVAKQGTQAEYILA
jgi:hypothetical protein